MSSKYSNSKNNSTYSATPPITLPTIGNPKWKRTFHSTDIKPSPSQSPTPTPTPTPSSFTSTCPICNQNQARYTCPKCSIPFCSVECYRVHDNSDNNNKNTTQSSSLSDNNNLSGGTCTEHFYRNKVKEICNLDIKNENNQSQMKEILTRSFYGNSNTNDNNGDNNVIDYKAKNQLSLNEDELIELASHLLSIKEIKDVIFSETDNNEHNRDYDYEEHLNNEFSNNGDDNDDDNNNNNDVENEKNYNQIPQHLRIKFEQAVKNGELSHLIHAWHPYWLPEILNIHEKHIHSPNEEQEATHLLHTFTRRTLDERILSIPKLAKVSDNPIMLHFNICEVLYNTVWILRLYNGFDVGFKQQQPQQHNQHDTDHRIDQTTVEDRIQAASYLYSQSVVLSKDERFENINGVLMDCSMKERDCNTFINDFDNNKRSVVDRKVLLNDVSNICKNQRMVIRVLFDAVEILDVGYKCLSNIKEESVVKRKKELKLAKKKVEYFLSWTALYWDTIGARLVHEIKDWGDDWILKDEERMNMKSIDVIGDISLPSKQLKDDSVILPSYIKSNHSLSTYGSLLTPISTKSIK